MKVTVIRKNGGLFAIFTGGLTPNIAKLVSDITDNPFVSDTITVREEGAMHAPSPEELGRLYGLDAWINKSDYVNGEIEDHNTYSK